MKRFLSRAAAVSALFLVASPTITVAQQPPADATTPPADGSPGPAAPHNDAARPATKATDEQNAASECKGLAEMPCRKNKICTWIIPKEPNKAGEVPPAYCRKLGPTKKKANDAAAPNAGPTTQGPPAPNTSHER